MEFIQIYGIYLDLWNLFRFMEFIQIHGIYLDLIDICFITLWNLKF